MLTQLLEIGKNISREALIQYYQAMIQRPDRTNVFRSFRKPVLFIIGKEDHAVSLQDSLSQCYIPAISYVHILENSGHQGMWEETELSNSHLVRFCQNSF
jgi:pimeloyl-ACP methyl ester carboxylesterase